MYIRVATLSDIEAMHRVRMAVKENILSDPGKVTPAHYQEMLLHKGKGWVCELEGELVGFAIADLSDSSIWALFVMPDYEGRQIGRSLHDAMVHWCFAQGPTKLWLTTSPNTRAERFYTSMGWSNKGLGSDGDLLFELEKPATGKSLNRA